MSPKDGRGGTQQFKARVPGVAFGQQINDPDAITLNQAEAMLKQVAPDIYRQTYRFVDGPGNYWGSRALAVSLTSAIVEHQHQYGTDLATANNVTAASGILARYDYPMYWVSGPLFESIKQTKPPVGRTWADLVFPYPGVTFMIPRGALKEPASVGGKEIMLLSVVKLHVGEEIKVPGYKKIVLNPSNWGPDPCDRITLFWPLGPHALTLQDVTFPVTQPLVPDASWIDQKTNEYREVTQYPHDAPLGDFTAWVSGLVANLLLLLSARPEYIEHGSRTTRKLKSGATIYSPTFVGRKYSIIRQQRSIAVGAHYTEIGWRSGHWKEQHFGPGNLQVKNIWVEPYIAFMRGLMSA